MRRDDLVFDVGMHRGEDTEHYLARGFRVVAIEANPVLVRAARERFAAAVETGLLTIVGAAVAAEPGTVELAVSEESTIWSSLDADFIARNRELGRTTYRRVEVPAVRFADVLAEHGVPYYLKIDIEGRDMLCVRALHLMSERPKYVSIESAVTTPGSGMEAVFDQLAELWTLGYRGFTLIDQNRHGAAFPVDSSGPFGEETRGHWAPIGPALARAAVVRVSFDVGGFGGRWGRTLLGRAYAGIRRHVFRRPLSWYDLHAKLG